MRVSTSSRSEVGEAVGVLMIRVALCNSKGSHLPTIDSPVPRHRVRAGRARGLLCGTVVRTHKRHSRPSPRPAANPGIEVSAEPRLRVGETSLRSRKTPAAAGAGWGLGAVLRRWREARESREREGFAESVQAALHETSGAGTYRYDAETFELVET